VFLGARNAERSLSTSAISAWMAPSTSTLKF
jgi:hypothetical protein